MAAYEQETEIAGSNLGGGGVDNLVAHAERVCTYEQRRIELRNEGIIYSLQGQFGSLVSEERRIESRLQMAPPPGDIRRLRRRAIYHWSVTTVLTVAGLAVTILTLAPFRLGWLSWLYSCGIAVIVPFLVEYLLNFREMERVVKALTAVAALAGIGSLMALAIIRGDLLAQELRQDAVAAVVIDDSTPQPEAQNTFYDSAIGLLRAALLLMAFAMEVGSGLALREAWRSAPDNSEDWDALRKNHLELRQRMSEILLQATLLRNEPEIFANRFWRDFYRSLILNAAKSATMKLLILIFGISLVSSLPASASDRLNLVIAIDLTRSVNVPGPDGKGEFQKNVDGVTRVLSQVPSGSRITVIGITDHSFAQPYILLSAHISDDPGYFAERLAGTRAQLVRAWRVRAVKLEPHFPHTDILGAMELAGQLFGQEGGAGQRMLIIFSDMRQSTKDLNLESSGSVGSFSAIADSCCRLSIMRNTKVFVFGVDGAGKSVSYWNELHTFWENYFCKVGATLEIFTVLRESPSFPTIR